MGYYSRRQFMTEDGHVNAASVQHAYMLGGGDIWEPRTGSSSPSAYSLIFDGVDDYCSFAVKDLNFGTGAFTLSAWFKHTGTFTDNKGVIASDAAANGSNGLLWYTATGPLLSIYPLGDSTHSSFTSNIFDAGWHHIVQGRSGTGSGQAFCYVDGVLQTMQSDTDNRTLVNVGPLTLGSGYSGLEWAPCQLYDVRVYNAALSGGNISTLYGGGSYTTNLLHHFRLPEGQGWWTEDNAGQSSGELLPLSGGPTWSSLVPQVFATTPMRLYPWANTAQAVKRASYY